MKERGLKVHANDHLKQCEIRARTILLLSEAPPFDGLEKLKPNGNVQKTFEGSNYLKVVEYLNRIEGIKDFFYYEYSPEGSSSNGEWERRYFTEQNSMKIDAIRKQILEWRHDGAITENEHDLLLVMLIEAVNQVANISGTYGCFLKKFDRNALDTIRLTHFDFVRGRTDHIVTNEDVLLAAKNDRSDVVYLDPPYTKRQYATYYHIPETIALEDKPEISGKTGIREWRAKSSEYCHKRKAIKALKELITVLWPRKIFLSYSSDGHMGKDEIIGLLEEFGPVTVHDYSYKRFNSGSIGSDTSAKNGKPLKEFLFSVGDIKNGQSIVEEAD